MAKQKNTFRNDATLMGLLTTSTKAVQSSPGKQANKDLTHSNSALEGLLTSKKVDGENPDEGAESEEAGSTDAAALAEDKLEDDKEIRERTSKNKKHRTPLSKKSTENNADNDLDSYYKRMAQAESTKDAVLSSATASSTSATSAGNLTSGSTNVEGVSTSEESRLTFSLPSKLDVPSVVNNTEAPDGPRQLLFSRQDLVSEPTKATSQAEPQPLLLNISDNPTRLVEVASTHAVQTFPQKDSPLEPARISTNSDIPALVLHEKTNIEPLPERISALLAGATSESLTLFARESIRTNLTAEEVAPVKIDPFRDSKVSEPSEKAISLTETKIIQRDELNQPRSAKGPESAKADVEVKTASSDSPNLANATPRKGGDLEGLLSFTPSDSQKAQAGLTNPVVEKSPANEGVLKSKNTEQSTGELSGILAPRGGAIDAQKSHESFEKSSVRQESSSSESRKLEVLVPASILNKNQANQASTRAVEQDMLGRSEAGSVTSLNNSSTAAATHLKHPHPETHKVKSELTDLGLLTSSKPVTVEPKHSGHHQAHTTSPLSQVVQPVRPAGTGLNKIPTAPAPSLNLKLNQGGRTNTSAALHNKVPEAVPSAGISPSIVKPANNQSGTNKGFELKAAVHEGYGFSPQSPIPGALVEHLVAHGVPKVEAELAIKAASSGVHHALESNSSPEGSHLVFQPQGEVALSIEASNKAPGIGPKAITVEMETLKEAHTKGIPQEGIDKIKENLGAEAAGMSRLDVLQTYGRDVVTSTQQNGYPKAQVQEMKGVLQSHARQAGISPNVVSNGKALQGLGAISKDSRKSSVTISDRGTSPKTVNISVGDLRKGMSQVQQNSISKMPSYQAERVRTRNF